MVNSQSQSLFDISNMSDLEIEVYADTVFTVFKNIFADQSYIESLPIQVCQELLLSINDSIEFFLEIEYLDYVEYMLESKIKLEKVIDNNQN